MATTIRLLGGRYRLKPYESNGCRCWELYIGGRTRPDCYPNTLGFALKWVAEYELRNGGDGVDDLKAALDRYESICESLADAAQSAFGGDGA
jgi:hypothetical protein